MEKQEAAVVVFGEEVVREAYAIGLAPEAEFRLQEITVAAKDAADFAVAAASVTVFDDASNEVASDYVVAASKIGKRLEDLRKYFTAPLKQRAKRIDEKFREWTLEPAGQEGRLRNEIGAYFLKKQEAARKAEIERQAKEMRARALGKTAPQVVVEQPVATTKTSTGSLNVRLVWGFDVENIDAVPRSYLRIDPDAVNLAIKDGVRTIAGLKISERPITTAR